MTPLGERSAARTPALESALRVAAHASQVHLRPDFQTTLRDRVMALAHAQADLLPTPPAPAATARPAAATGWNSGPRVQLALRLTVGSLACLLAATGIATSSSRALPGDLFYPAKRAAERWETQATAGDAAKGARHFALAATRLDEIGRLTRSAQAYGPVPGVPGRPLAGGLAFGGGSAGRIVTALGDMDTETRQGSELLTAAFRQDGGRASLRVITRFTTRQGRELQDLIPSLPAVARDLAQASLGLVTQLGATAQRTLTAGTHPAGTSPAANHPAAAGTDTPPPAAAPGTDPTGPPPSQGSTDPSSADAPAGPGAGAGSPPPVRPDAAGPAQAGAPTAGPPTAPAPTGSPTPTPGGPPTSSPTPSPTPSPSAAPLPLPAPLPQPPPLPVPLPTLAVPTR